MDNDELLGVTASFERVALAVERDGIDAHTLERVMELGHVTFGQMLTRRDGGSTEPFVKIQVTGWRGLQITNRDNTIPELLTRVLRDLAYEAKRERLGFTRELTDVAFDIAQDPSRYSNELLRGALRTLRAVHQHSRDYDERTQALAYVRRLENSELGDRPS